MISSKKNLLTDQNLKITFQTLDFDNNGTLTMQELKRAFEFGGNQKTDKFWENFMKEVDINKDGVISFEEFRVTMQKMLQTM